MTLSSTLALWGESNQPLPCRPVPHRPSAQRRKPGPTFLLRGYHFSCLLCLLSQSHVSKSSSTSPRKLLRLNVSRCQTDRFSFCVFKTCLSILYCGGEKTIKMKTSIALCQSYGTERRSPRWGSKFLPCLVSGLKSWQRHPTPRVWFQRATTPSFTKADAFLSAGKGELWLKYHSYSNIIARNSFLKTEVDYSALLDAFTLDTA